MTTNFPPRRLSTVYVQVPAAPHAASALRSAYTPARAPFSAKLKENAPLRPISQQMTPEASTSASAPQKRKVSERDPSSLVLDGVVIISKKLKMSSGTLKPTQVHSNNFPNDASNDVSKTFAYCHQCCKKRDVEDIIRCTVVERFQKTRDKSIRERPCINKYCKPCLQNRYGEDFDILKSGLGKANDFKCPRCRDICNCPKCRKSKGLEPTGVMFKVKATDTNGPKRSRKSGIKQSVTGSSKSNAPTKVQQKPLPIVMWTSIPTHLSYEEITERIFIREFFARFADILDPPLAKSHLDELEIISGRPCTSASDESWVTDACIKACVISMLGLLARNFPDDISKIFKTTIKDVRSAGTNLNRIWALLSTLRDQVQHTSLPASGTPGCEGGSDGSAFLLSNPADLPPDLADARRSLRQSENEPNIVLSSQMIPVLTSMINHALVSHIIREDIEQAGKDVKEWAPIVKEALKLEHERWETDRDTIIPAKDKAQKMENKAKRDLHKEQLENIENSMKIIAPFYAPRFMSIGVDDEKREYFALSPSTAEREAAAEYLDVAAENPPYKCKKKGRILTEEERCNLQDWSWFIAIYGTKPPGAAVAYTPFSSRDNAGNSLTDDSIPRWWGFWDPKEINMLAEWLAIKSGLESKNETNTSGPSTALPKPHLSPHDAQLNQLIASLKEQSRLLEWRTKPSKCQLVKKSLADDRK